MSIAEVGGERAENVRWAKGSIPPGSGNPAPVYQ